MPIRQSSLNPEPSSDVEYRSSASQAPTMELIRVESEISDFVSDTKPYGINFMVIKDWPECLGLMVFFRTLKSPTRMETMERTLKNVASSWQHMFETGKSSAVTEHYTPDCIRTIAPASFMRQLGMPGDYKQDASDFKMSMESQLPALNAVSTTLRDYVIDPTNRKGCMYISHELKVKDSDETFIIENMSIMYFTEDGTKVKEILMFTDPLETLRYQMANAEALKKMSAAT